MRTEGWFVQRVQCCNVYSCCKGVTGVYVVEVVAGKCCDVEAASLYTEGLSVLLLARDSTVCSRCWRPDRDKRYSARMWHFTNDGYCYIVSAGEPTGKEKCMA